MRRILYALVWGLVVLGVAGQAQAQLAKSGKFSGQFSWHYDGRSDQLGEKYSIWTGRAWGLFNNAAGSGFLHNAVVQCTGNDLAKGDTTLSVGGCAIWDADGDAAVVDWNCMQGSDGWCKGAFEWRGGTGKYNGITGKVRFRHTGLTYRPDGIWNTGEGYSLWEGEYRLP
jgi:hypothetical protein